MYRGTKILFSGEFSCTSCFFFILAAFARDLPYDQWRNAVANDALRYKVNIDEELKNCSDIGIGEYRKEEEEVEEPSTAVLSASENVHLAQIDTTGDDLTHLQHEAEDAIPMSPQEPPSPATDQIKDVSPMSPEEPSSVDVRFSADDEVDLSSVDFNESKEEVERRCISR